MFMPTHDNKAQSALSFLFSELTYVEQEVLRQPYPEIKYPEILPVSSEAPEYADSIAFKTMDFRGEPQLLGSRSGDVPLIEVASSKGSVTVHTYSQGYDYTIVEVGKAQELARNDRAAAINFLAEKANGARQVVEQFLDKAFFLGDDRTADVKTGLVNDNSVPEATTGDFLPGGSDKTIEEIVDGTDAEEVANELLQLFNRAKEKVRVEQTNTIYRPTHFLLPPYQLGLLESYRIPNTSDTLISYLSRVLGMDFAELLHLKGAGTDEADRMMVYTRDTNHVKAHMPMPFQLQAPGTADNVSFVSAGLVRIAGTELRIPKQHLYVDGV